MSETKQKKTLSKLGRLFGVSSTNLSSLPHNSKSSHNNVSLDSITGASASTSTGTSGNSLSDHDTRSQSRHASTRAKSPASQLSKTSAHSSVAEAHDDDVLAPLPNERSATGSPAIPANTVSPSQSMSSVDLSHLQAITAAAIEQPPGTGTRSRSPSVSRSSSLNGYARKNNAAALAAKAKPTSVSRSPSEKKAGHVSPSTISPSVSSTQLPGISPSNAPASNKPRFRMFEDGSHEHNLRAAKRQEKLSNMLKDLLGAKKLRDEAKSAVPNILSGKKADKDETNPEPPTLFAGLVSQVKNNTSPYHAQADDLIPKQDSRSFVEKYGRCQEVIGRGSFGVVRISHKKTVQTSKGPQEVLYAVKEFKKRPNESEKKYSRRLTSEFCISSSLKHLNIIDTLDLLKDAKGDYCEVMEFCSGGDLYTLIIAAGKLEYAEADCFFKQLIRGVNYMHDMGVSHRDLKPENLLLTQQGVLKITDFGNGECFKMAWEDEIHFSDGISGSSPYIAPEEFTQDQFDSRCVDIWACGVIYMAMRTGRQLWKLADSKRDEFFEEYLVQRKDATGYEPIESLKRARCRNVIYSILDPIPERRITGKQILNSEWGREIRVCEAGEAHHEAPQSKEKVSERLDMIQQ
ncbi:hypothetical protein JCM33374_g4019 [Metschnikowia sp. JCM 33374]|nr:hypothetical protein JCM33374_g4019 [Metschnikowia sp. JCM 33374]